MNIVTTEPIIDRQSSHTYAENIPNELLNETAPIQGFENQETIRWFAADIPSVSKQAEACHPSKELWLQWNLDEVKNQLSSSLVIEGSDESETNFPETRLGICVNYTRDITNRRNLRTDDERQMPIDSPRNMLGSSTPPEQWVAWPTEPKEGTYKDILEALLTMDAELTRPEEQRRLLRRLRELEQVPESQRWPAADWPSSQSFADARTFIHSLGKSPMPLPNLALADDGEINFYWGQNGIHIDLGFYGTGTYSYFARSTEEEGFYDNDVPASSGLPGKLLVMLKS